jgi:hypothetical protein
MNDGPRPTVVSIPKFEASAEKMAHLSDSIQRMWAKPFVESLSKASPLLRFVDPPMPLTPCQRFKRACRRLMKLRLRNPFHVPGKCDCEDY